MFTSEGFCCEGVGSVSIDEVKRVRVSRDKGGWKRGPVFFCMKAAMFDAMAGYFRGRPGPVFFFSTIVQPSSGLEAIGGEDVNHAGLVR